MEYFTIFIVLTIAGLIMSFLLAWKASIAIKKEDSLRLVNLNTAISNQFPGNNKPGIHFSYLSTLILYTILILSILYFRMQIPFWPVRLFTIVGFAFSLYLIYSQVWINRKFSPVQTILIFVFWSLSILAFLI